MPTLFNLQNFSQGIHTRPSQIRSGDAYLADIQNLVPDGEGALTLRPAIGDLGPTVAGHTVTGITASPKKVILLRSDAKLYIRDVDDLTTEQIIPGYTGDMRGRLSGVHTFSNYSIVTSEGTDQGFWISHREEDPLWAYNLGINPPLIDALRVVSTVPNEFQANVNAFVAFAITYVRQFPTGDGNPTQLFNGVESEIGLVHYYLTVPFSTAPTNTGIVYIVSSAEWRWNNAINVNTPESTNAGISVVDDKLYISFRDADGANRQTALESLIGDLGSRLLEIHDQQSNKVIKGTIVRAEAIATALVLTINWTDRPEITTGNLVKIGLSAAPRIALNVGDYYPATLYLKHIYADPQVTGINIYRSRFFKDAADYTPIKNLLDEGEIDFTNLELRKVAYVSKGQTEVTYGVEADGRIYYKIGADAKQYHVWDDAEPYVPYVNRRLPSTVKQIHYEAGRIFAPNETELRFSGYDGTIPALWRFPPINSITPTDGSRVEFAASTRGFVVFGGPHSLWRLSNPSYPRDGAIEKIGANGPVDPYAWGYANDALLIVSGQGLLQTDADQVVEAAELVA